MGAQKNSNNVFRRPPQSKAKENYLYLNNTSDENNCENLNIEEQQIQDNHKFQEDDSYLNNEIKCVENLRIQNAT